MTRNTVERQKGSVNFFAKCEMGIGDVVAVIVIKRACANVLVAKALRWESWVSVHQFCGQ